MVDRQVGAGASEQALLDYFDDLLGDVTSDFEPLLPAPAMPASELETAPLVRKAAETKTVLPFAEPERAFILRMPLPTVAPPEVALPEVAPPEPASLELATPVVADAIVEAPAWIDPERGLPSEPMAPPVFVAPVEIIAAEAQPEAPSRQEIVSPPEPASNLSNGESEPGYNPKPWLANGRPEWAQEPFECLLFRVGGLAMAVPLVELGTIHPLADNPPTPLFGQAPWFMGLLSVKDDSVRVIDSAQVVMPERYDPAMREQYRYVITLNGSDWGLAVDTVINAVRLEPEQVRWRSARSQRPWLAGTVVAQMCALIDGSQLIALFNRQDRKRRALQRQ